MPLLIGSATTSAQAHGHQDRLPGCGSPVLHVEGRLPRPCVGVVRSADAARRRAGRTRPGEPARLQEKDRDAFRAPGSRKLVPLPGCPRSDDSSIDWGKAPAGNAPPFSARRCCATSRSAASVPYIDWSPFFMAWELAGNPMYPAIFNDPHAGKEARQASDRKARGPLAGESLNGANTLTSPDAVYGFFLAKLRRRRPRHLQRRSRRWFARRSLPDAARRRWAPRGPDDLSSALADFVAPAAAATRTTSAVSRCRARFAPRSCVRRSAQGRPRRLQRPFMVEAPRRPPRRGFRRSAPRMPRRRLGLRQRRGTVEGGGIGRG